MRRLLLFVALLILWTIPAHASCPMPLGNGWTCKISLGQGSTDSNGFTTTGIDTSGATLIKLFVSTNSVYTGGCAGIIDSKSNTLTGTPPTTQTSTGGNGMRLVTCYVKNPTVGTGHTWALTCTTCYPTFLVMALSGADTTAPFDQENGTFNNATASLATGSVTPSQGSSLFVAGLSLFGNTTTPSLDSSFTSIEHVAVAGGAHFAGDMWALTQASTAAVAPTWTWTTNAEVATNLEDYKPGAAAPSGPNVGSDATMGAGK
jgi:hypothetical protein